jgi:ligand-binding sensor domain-containing protein
MKHRFRLFLFSLPFRIFLQPALLAFVMCLFALPSNSQLPIFKNFNVKDRLPSSEVYNVMQDSKGYMWFCTDAGVSRYDGNVFHNFSTRNGLGDNTVFGTLEDRKGNIWFRSFSGRLYYYRGDSIYGIGANEKMASLIRGGLLTSMYIDPGDTIWCGTYATNFYFKIAPPYQEGNLSCIPMLTGGSEEFDIDGKGYVFSYSFNDKVNLNDLTILHTVGIRDKIGGKRIANSESLSGNSFFLKLKDGHSILIGNKFIFKFGSNEVYRDQRTPFLSAYEDINKNIWVGGQKKGVYFFPKGKLNIKKPLNYLNGLSVTGIKEDSEGGFWFTTLENGVYYMTSSGLLYYDKNSGLEITKVTSLLARNDSSIWVGLGNGNIAVVTGDTAYTVPIRGTAPNDFVYKLFKNPVSDELVVGTNHSFISEPEKHSMEIIRKGHEFVIYKCFTSDKEKFIWAGNHSMLSKIDPVKKIVLETFPCKSRVLAIYCDSSNKIWLGCTNGLWSFKDGQFSYEGNSNPLFKNRIEDIKESADHVWWFATKGIGVIVKRGNDILSINETNGLSSNLCRNIYLDDKGSAWVSTNNGISRIRMPKWREFTIDVYSADDGLPSNEINEIVRTGNRIWAASNQGIVAFDVSKIFVNLSPPPVYITGLEINSLKRTLKDTFRLRYFENYLKIDFTGLSYKRNSRLRYKYKLDGLDTDWKFTQSGTIQYTTLPSGNYRFLVYAINNDGMSSLKPASLYFSISKPFWKEWWFMISVGCIILAIAFWMGNYRLRQLQKVVNEKAEVNRKIADLKLMALRAQMNPHFIFNSINSIQLFILKNDTDAAHKHLSRFSKLIRQVLENSKHEYIPLSEEIQSLELYIELERLRFSSKFDFKITAENTINVENVLISPMLIQPYVENAIWHGLMHLKNRPGELDVRLEKHGDLLKIIIDDNGIGRKNSMLFKKDRTHKSIGLSINKERVDILNSLHHNSSLNITFIDKMGPDGESLGTRVEINLPYMSQIHTYEA